MAARVFLRKRQDNVFMETFGDYVLGEKIEETRTSRVYRAAVKEDPSRRVIVKLLNIDNPSPAEIARFNKEYALIRAVEDEAVIRVLETVEEAGRVALILEDFDGLSLDKVSADGLLPLEKVLHIGIKIAGVLDKFHKKNIIHKDIKPHNVLFNRDTNQVKLSDFGIATELTHARDILTEEALADGTLAYMAPEQTGRMNRSVSYHSDLYSLGITFYELLTGRLPFDDVTDPVAYFHAHIARRPVPPAELNSAVPLVLSEIVMKLMAKEFEDRYQSASGLQYDLQVCFEQLKDKGFIESFPLASRDISLSFAVPRRPIGRESETARMLEAFRRVEGGGAVFLLISGDAGSGKSFFVNESHKAIAARRGFVCSGAFEAQNRSIPYSAFVAAFQNLLNQLLTAPAEKIAAWRHNLLEVLGTNARLLTDIIPELALIIGEQPPVPALDSEEARHRFNYVFKNFVRVFAKKSHPLTIILEDLHLADPAGLDLLGFLAGESDLGYFFIVGTFRSDASDLGALRQVIGRSKETRVDIEEMELTAFSLTQVNGFIAAALQCHTRQTEELADIVYKKTNGVPFFVAQFVTTIYNQGLLTHSAAQGWQWQTEEISRLDITDNVVDMMVSRIRSLDGGVAGALKAAAVIGNRFDLDLLSRLLERPLDEVLNDVAGAEAEDMVVQDGLAYRFGHEKIREAAYSMIEEAVRPKMHQRVGRILLERAGTREEGVKEDVFYIVRHLNAGATTLNRNEERQELAWLNYLAGEKARSATAYEAAADYFARAEAFLPQERWTSHYDFSWTLLLVLGETLFLTGETEKAEAIFEEMLANARDDICRAEVYALMVTLNTAIDKPDKALEIGLTGLSLLGVHLPKNPGKLTILINVLKVRLAQGRRKTEDMAELPALDDPEKKAVMSLLSMIGAPAYYPNPTLFAVIITRGVQLSLRHGLPELAAYGMIAMGLIMGSRMGFYDYGHRLAKAGLEVMKRFNDVKSFARSYFIYAYFILPWREHARECRTYLSLAYKYGMETGDVIFTGHSINVAAAYAVLTGEPLDHVFKDHQAHKAFLEKINSPFILNNYLDTYEIVAQLKGIEDDSQENLQTKWHDREERLKAIEDENLQLGMFIHYVKRQLVMFFFDHRRECYDLGCQAEPIVEYALGTLYVSEHYFLWSLAAAGLHDEAAVPEKRVFVRLIRRNLRKYKRWADNCPDNFLHKYQLLKAELARISKKPWLAARLYHQALVTAGQSGFVHHEAITAELAARFYFFLGYEEVGRAYVFEARKAYHRWGAVAKVRRLDQLYPEAGSVMQVRSGTGDTSSTITSSVIDLSILRKTLKTIAEEKIHSLMLEKIIRASVEFAGAQKGLLILRKGEASEDDEADNGNEIIDTLFVEAEWLVDTREVTIMQSVPVKGNENLSRVVINYVARAGKSVVIHNAQEPQQVLPTLQTDDYIRDNGVRSLLCLPITANAGSGDSELTGLFYFENNLTSHAFTRERIETLEIISLSAAGRLELSRKAVTDGLTGLYNHDYFQNMLQQDVLLAQRKGRQLSVVMIDIDHFKQFNDSWGHQAGDLVLKEVAATIRESCRGSDIVARYGGEEMVLLLHETPPENAFTLAENIRKKIESLRIKYQDKGRLRVTISMGVAGFPDHARDRKTLVKKADDALYLSKKNGRNRTTLAVI